MTLHAVIGEGSINTRELKHQLDDLMEKATNADQNFWFIVQGKATPTKADQDLIAYFAANDLYYVTLTLDGVTPDGLYDGASDGHEYVGNFGAGLLEALKELREEEDDEVDVLAMLVNPKEEDPADAEVTDALFALIEAGYKIYGLNDSMEQITIEEEAETEQIEPTDATPNGDVAGPDQGPFTEEELQAKSPAEVKALASGMGVTGRGKKEHIQGILTSQGGAVVTPLHTTTTTTGSLGAATFVVNGASEQAIVVIHSSKGVQIKHVSLAAAEAL